MRPDQPSCSSSKSPWVCASSSVVYSSGCSRRSKPPLRTIAWIADPRRSVSGVLVTVIVTRSGVFTPAGSSSRRDRAGSYDGHAVLVFVANAVLGEIGEHAGADQSLKTDRTRVLQSMDASSTRRTRGSLANGD